MVYMNVEATKNASIKALLDSILIGRNKTAWNIKNSSSVIIDSIYFYRRNIRAFSIAILYEWLVFFKIFIVFRLYDYFDSLIIRRLFCLSDPIGDRYILLWEINTSMNSRQTVRDKVFHLNSEVFPTRSDILYENDIEDKFNREKLPIVSSQKSSETSVSY